MKLRMQFQHMKLGRHTQAASAATLSPFVCAWRYWEQWRRASLPPNTQHEANFMIPLRPAFSRLKVLPSATFSSHTVPFGRHFSKAYAIARSLQFNQPKAYFSNTETPRFVSMGWFSQSSPVTAANLKKVVVVFRFISMTLKYSEGKKNPAQIRCKENVGVFAFED